MARSVAAIIVDNGRVLVARRKPGGDLGGKWEFPGGKIEPGEEPEDAVRRELLEEFGVQGSALAHIGSSTFEHGGKRFELLAYETRLLSPISSHPEHEELAWAVPAELQALNFADSDKGLFPFVRKLCSRHTATPAP